MVGVEKLKDFETEEEEKGRVEGKRVGSKKESDYAGRPWLMLWGKVSHASP